MSNETDKPRTDTDPPDADWQWRELQQKLEGKKPAQEEAEEDEVVTDEIVEGDEVASAARSQTKRVLKKLKRGI